MASLFIKVDSVTFLILSTVFINMTHVRATNVDMMSIDGGQSIGVAKNCGDVPFKFTWSPDQLSSYGSVTIYFNYTFPHDFHNGTYFATAAFHQARSPFVGYRDSIDCKQIFEPLLCPIKQSAPLQIFKTFTELAPLASYPGEFDLHLEAKNNHNQMMICMDLYLVVKEP